MPQGLLSHGTFRRPTSMRRRSGALPARCPAPFDEAKDKFLVGPLCARRARSPRPPFQTGGLPRLENVAGPRPPVRTCSPKEADVTRDEGRCAGVVSGPRPFLGRRASSRGPRDAPSWRGASRRSNQPRGHPSPGLPRRGGRLAHGLTTVPRRLRLPSWPLTPPDFQSRVCEIPRGSRSPR
jgi:hypothetical protein